MILAPHILRCIAPADRKLLGKGGLLPEEALARAEVKNERDLQRQIIALLRLKGIEPIVSSMHKRTTNNLGTPDILFAIIGQWSGIDKEYLGTFEIACGWEVKFGDGKLSVEQQQMHVRMSTPPNAWRISVIKSVDDAIAELKELGIE